MALKTEVHEFDKPIYAALVRLHTLPYVKKRMDIHKEIIEREEGWRVSESDEPPPITSYVRFFRIKNIESLGSNARRM